MVLETMLIMAGIGALGGLISQAFAAGDKAKAEQYRNLAMAELGIELPPIEVIAVNPEIVESAAAKVGGNLEAQQTRMDALRQLSRRAGEGYTVEERAALNQALGDVAAQERGAREAIMRKLPAQSGARVAAMLSNQQAAAQQASQQGLDIAAQGRRKALEALAATGKLAGDIDVDAFNQAMAKAQQMDAISKFNVANKFEAARLNEANRLQREFERNRLLMERAATRSRTQLGMSDYYQRQAEQTLAAGGQATQAAQTAAGQYASEQAYGQDPSVILRRRKAEEELKKYGDY